MDAPYYNGGPDDYAFQRRTRGEREHGKGRCRRCANPIIVAHYVIGYGDVCSCVCRTLAEQQLEAARGKTA